MDAAGSEKIGLTPIAGVWSRTPVSIASGRLSSKKLPPEEARFEGWRWCIDVFWDGLPAG